MKKTIKRVMRNPLISGSFFLFSGGMVANIFNFAFNLLMSRNLEVAEYGALISIVSIITLLSVVAGAVSPTVVTLAGRYFAQNNVEMLHSLYLKIFKAFLLLGVCILIPFLVFSSYLSSLLHISNVAVFNIIPFAIIVSFFITLNQSFAQARLSFRFLSLSSAISSFTKVTVGFGLVFLGMGLGGAITGYLISFIVPLLMSTFFLGFIIFYKKSKAPKISYRELISYGIPSAIVVFCLNAFISVDIILVKHFFNEYQAGQYAGLSLVGRVIFYVTSPITTVMFPAIVNKHATGQNYKKILYSALLLVGGVSTLATIFYFSFSNFSILFFLKKEEYLSVAQNLGAFGIFVTLYSLLSIFSYVFLSIKKTYFSYILLFGVILQSYLIYVFHSSFSQVILVSSIVMAILLGISCMIYLIENKSRVANTS